VPTPKDFTTLDKLLGGTGDGTNQNDVAYFERYVSAAWGGTLGGEFAFGWQQSGYGAYWSSEKLSITAYGLTFASYGKVRVNDIVATATGRQVRCVK
jgi:hypothetical protein